MNYTTGSFPARTIVDNLRFLVLIEGHKDSEKKEELMQRVLSNIES